uniref:Uncharacterized protein n=2 Tax=Picea TaxID=3328 RepID=A0A101M1X1_PICGL|nr:hypothetical protein ABT39_MTgene4005 [Picea glauca]QHR89699.1 hypothetical protein Q903MT_gene3721 [Picea sitchensis]
MYHLNPPRTRPFQIGTFQTYHSLSLWLKGWGLIPLSLTTPLKSDAQRNKTLKVDLAYGLRSPWNIRFILYNRPLSGTGCPNGNAPALFPRSFYPGS